MPFADLKETIENLRSPVRTVSDKTHVKLSNITDGLGDALKTIETNAKAAVPGGLSMSSVATPDQNYQTKLNQCKDAVAVQVAIVKAVQTAGAHWNNDPQQQQVVSTALGQLNDLDLFGNRPSNQQEAETRIKPIIDKLPTTARLMGTAEPLVSVHELQLRNERINWIMWGLWLVVTVALGVYLLVDTQPGFGTSSDLWKCFFWGLGISVAGQQFNPSTVTTALNVTLPKA